MRLSVIIPTLMAETGLPACLRALGDVPTEVLVVDAGSIDRTGAIAEMAGARVLTGARGRGPQLALGGDVASGDWLLFLHADTVLDPGWAGEAKAFAADPANARRAAYFRFALDETRAEALGAARRLERIVAWRCRVFGLPYGDQGLLLSRDLYRALGGYQPLPLMEDVDLVRRVGRSAMVGLPAAARTSAKRYARGYLRRSTRNLICLGLYMTGVPPRTIKRLYET